MSEKGVSEAPGKLSVSPDRGVRPAEGRCLADPMTKIFHVKEMQKVAGPRPGHPEKELTSPETQGRVDYH